MLKAHNDSPIRKNNVWKTIRHTLFAIMASPVFFLASCAQGGTVQQPVAIEKPADELGEKQDLAYSSWVSRFLESRSGFVGVNNDTFAEMPMVKKDPAAYRKYLGASVYVSEGYGYGSHIALANKDVRLFGDLAAAVQLLRAGQSANLMRWAVDDNRQSIAEVGGENAALDADLDQISAMILAYRSPAMTSPAEQAQLKRTIVDYAYAIWTNGVATLSLKGNDFYLLKPADGNWMFDAQGGVQIYTSYCSPAWYKLIGDFLKEATDVNPDAARLAEQFYQLRKDTWTLLNALALSSASKHDAEDGVVLPSKVMVSVENTELSFYIPAGQEAYEYDDFELIRLPWRLAVDQSWYQDLSWFGQSGLNLTRQTSIGSLQEYVLQFESWAQGQTVDAAALVPQNVGQEDYYRTTLELLFSSYLSGAITPNGLGDQVRAHDYTHALRSEMALDIYFNMPDSLRTLTNHQLSVPLAQEVINNRWLEDQAAGHYIHEQNAVRDTRILLKAVGSILGNTGEDNKEFMDVDRFKRAALILEYLLTRGYGNSMYYVAEQYAKAMRDDGRGMQDIILSLQLAEQLRVEKASQIAETAPFAKERQAEYLWGAELLRLYRYSLIATEGYYARQVETMNEINSASAYVVQPEMQEMVSVLRQLRAVRILLSQNNKAQANKMILEIQQKVQQINMGDLSNERTQQLYRQVLLEIALIEPELGSVLDDGRRTMYENLYAEFMSSVVKDPATIDNGNSIELLANNGLYRLALDKTLGGLDSQIGKVSPLSPLLSLPLAGKDEAKQLLLGAYQWQADRLAERVYNGDSIEDILNELESLLASPSGEAARVMRFATGQAVPGVFDEGLGARFPVELESIQYMRYGYNAILLYKALPQDQAVAQTALFEGKVFDAVEHLLSLIGNDSLRSEQQKEKLSQLTESEIEVMVMSAQEMLLQWYAYQLEITTDAAAKQNYRTMLLDIIAYHPRASVYLGRTVESENPQLAAVGKAIRDITYAQRQLEPAPTWAELKQDHAVLLEKLTVVQLREMFVNYDDLLKHPENMVQINPRYDLRNMRPEGVSIVAWNNFRNTIIPYGYFDNLQKLAPYLAKTAELLYWSGDAALKDSAFMLLMSLVEDYPALNAGQDASDITAGIGDTRFMSTFYTIMLNMLRQDDASLRAKAMEVLRNLDPQEFSIMLKNYAEKTLQERGPFSQEYVSLLVVYSRVLSISSAGDVDWLYRSFEQLKSYVKPNSQNVASLIELAKNLATAYKIRQGSTASYVQSLIKDLEGYTELIGRVDLLSGSQKYWVYMDMYELTGNRVYKDKILADRELWSQDNAFMRYLQNKGFF